MHGARPSCPTRPSSSGSIATRIRRAPSEIDQIRVAVEYTPPPTSLYRSVGVNAANLNTSARTVQIAGNTATFSGAMPANVGVGDVLQYQVAATYYLAFI